MIMEEKQLIEYCKDLNINGFVLDDDDRNNIIKLIEKLYVRKGAKYGFSLFDMLKFEELEGISLIDSWRWVHDFIKDRDIVVFFNFKCDRYVYLENGSAFIDFYENCYENEFYITNRSAGFLMGYNHSHCLFAMGTAIKWLENTQKYKDYYKKSGKN